MTNLLKLSSAAALTIGVTACGISAKNQNSAVKHYPVKGFDICESTISIDGDPHAMNYARKVIFTSALSSATIQEFAARSMYLTEAKDIFNEGFQTGSETYDLSIRGSELTLLKQDPSRAAAGSIKTIAGAEKKIALTVNGTTETLNCRRSGK